jgi:ATP-dependent Zn protease
MRPPAKVPKTIHSRRLQATAHHEAGHAVAAWRKGLRFKHVTIEPNAEAGSLGHLLHSSAKWFNPEIDQSDRAILHAERHIITAFAGQIAEAKFLGRRVRYGMKRDNEGAVDLGIRMCGSSEVREAYLRYCFLASRNLVDANWKAIEAVAEALLERRTLSQEDVIEVIMPGSAAFRATLERAAAKQKKG